MKQTAILLIVAFLAVLQCGNPSNPYHDPLNAEVGLSVTDLPSEGFVVGNTVELLVDVTLGDLLDSLSVRVGNWDTSLVGLSISDDTVRVRKDLTQVGSITVSCYATANRVLVIDTSFVIVVSDTNSAPSWSKDSLVLQGNENSLIECNLADSCSDVNDDPLSFRALSTTLTGDSLYEDGRYTFSASYIDSGSYQVVAEVSDGLAADTVAITVVIANVNRKPQFLDSLPKTVCQIDETDLLVIGFAAQDEDGDSVWVYIKETNLPRKDEINLGDSTLNWQATSNDNNAYYLLLAATDGRDTTVARIDIGVGFVNLPPRISIAGVPDGGTVQAKEGDTLRFTVEISDPNLGDTAVLLSAENLPFATSANGTGAYDTASGEFWFVPSFDVSSQSANSALDSIVFYAQDAGDPPLSDTFEVSITVENINRAPSVTLLVPMNGELAVARNQVFSWVGQDPDGDDLNFTLSIGTLADQLEAVYQGSSTSFSDSTLINGGQHYYWRVSVDDGMAGGSSITRSFTVNQVPTVILLSPQNGASGVGIPCTLSWSGADPDGADVGELFYDVYLAEFGGPWALAAKSLMNSEFVVDSLLLGSSYQWKVLATDGKDSTASISRTFGTYSPNVNLESLLLDPVLSLDPVFSPDSLAYSVQTFRDTINILAGTTEELAYLEVNGVGIASGVSYSLPLGSDTAAVSILCFVPGFDTSTYSIQVCRVTPKYVAVAGGGDFTLALKNDGSLWGKGYNANGQLGTGDTAGLAQFTRLDVPEAVKTIAVAQRHSVAVDTLGRLWVVGYNAEGQLGLGNRDQVLIWTLRDIGERVREVKAGRAHSIAVTESGLLYVAGDNSYGQLGMGDRDDRLIWVQNPLVNGVKRVAAGAYHSLLMTDAGTMLVAGKNGDGEIGAGDTTSLDVWTVSSPTNVVWIAAGSYHSLCINSAGALFGAGANWFGELGNGEAVTWRQWYSTFPGGTPTMADAGNYFSWLLMSNGTLEYSGNNDYGQLGTGDNNHELSWTASTFAQPVAQLDIGETHTVVLDSSGVIWITGQGITTFLQQ